MNKLLVICGPTATGKTHLAIQLAQKFNGELVSADARQIYRTLNAATGKQYSDDVPIWGYDLIDPSESFSVSQYIQFAHSTIQDISSRGKLPILVGGTGFYIKGVIDGIATATIPPDEKLRESLSDKSAQELYEMLKDISIEKATNLNASDSKNPRRLIRALEVIKNPPLETADHPSYTVLEIGLTAPLTTLVTRMEKNIDGRLENTIAEINNHLANGGNWSDKGMQSLGIRQLKEMYQKHISKEAAVMLWKTEERKYIKRQLTWFKKDKRIVWFDITENDFIQKVEQLVETWDNKQ